MKTNHEIVLWSYYFQVDEVELYVVVVSAEQANLKKLLNFV